MNPRCSGQLIGGARATLLITGRANRPVGTVAAARLNTVRSRRRAAEPSLIGQARLADPGAVSPIETTGTSSQDHDPATPRKLADGKCVQEHPPIQGEAGPKSFAPGEQRPPVCGRIGDQEDHIVDPAVASLASDPPVEGLDVAQAGLGLDGKTSVTRRDRGVPGSGIARDRQRHLRSPDQVRTDPPAQPGEEADLGDVPDRITPRVGPDRKVETHGRADPRQQKQIGTGLTRAFDPADRRMGDTRGRTHRRLAKPGHKARFSHLLTKGHKSAPGKSVAAIDRTLSGGHHMERWHAALGWRSTRISLSVVQPPVGDSVDRSGDPSARRGSFAWSTAPRRSRRPPAPTLEHGAFKRALRPPDCAAWAPFSHTYCSSLGHESGTSALLDSRRSTRPRDATRSGPARGVVGLNTRGSDSGSQRPVHLVRRNLPARAEPPR